MSQKRAVQVDLLTVLRKSKTFWNLGEFEEVFASNAWLFNAKGNVYSTLHKHANFQFIFLSKSLKALKW